MAISYVPLDVTLARRRLRREQLIRDKVFSRATSAKISRGDYVSLEVIDRICEYLRCGVEDVIEWVPNE